MITMAFEPRVLKVHNLGLVIEVARAKKWATVVARDAAHVYTKRVRTAQLDEDGVEFDYPKGIEQAADRFLHPAMGIATVMPDAITYLENIMKTYTTKASAKRALGKIGDFAAEKADEFISVDDDGSVQLNDTGAEVYQYDCVVHGKEEAEKLLHPVEKAAKRKDATYALVANADFSKRKGGFRLTLDGLAAGHTTATAIWVFVKQTKPDYKLADIYSDITMGRKYGYIRARA